jgi:hypothetical protein
MGEPKRRRVMRAFKLGEISAVDNPAQQGAVATIMKRDEEPHHHTKEAPMPYQETNFAELVREIQKRDGLTRTDAMHKARRVNPSAYAKLNDCREPVNFGKPEDVYGRAVFEMACDEIQKRDDCDRMTAMRTVRIESPEIYAMYNEADEIPVIKAKAAAEAEFEREVAGEMARTGCSSLDAMRWVRRKRPDLTKAMNAEAVAKVHEIDMPDREMIAGERAKMDWNNAVEETAKRLGIDFTTAMSRVRKERPELYAAFQCVGGE